MRVKAAFVFKFRLKITRCAKGNKKTNSPLIPPWEQARAYALSPTSTQPAAVVLSTTRMGWDREQDSEYGSVGDIQVWQGSKNLNLAQMVE